MQHAAVQRTVLLIVSTIIAVFLRDITLNKKFILIIMTLEQNETNKMLMLHPIMDGSSTCSRN